VRSALSGLDFIRPKDYRSVPHYLNLACPIVMSQNGIAVEPSREDSQKMFCQPASSGLETYRDVNNPTNREARSPPREAPLAATTQKTANYRYRWIWVVGAALVGALVVAAAVGGGLGSQLASCHNDRKYGVSCIV